MILRDSHSAKQRGSAILMVLWGMMVMTMAVGGLIQYMRSGVLQDVQTSKEFQARLLAESGIALALHPKVGKNDPVLKQRVSSVRSYDVTLTTEGARIAINQIVTKEQIHNYCVKLFIIWGIDPEKSGIAADSLRDWVDADDSLSPFGAEGEFYALRGSPQYPRNIPFRHLDEMLFVRGMRDIAQRKPNWRDYFTLHGDGLIDVNEASSELIEIVCEVARPQADQLVLQRYGPDLVAGNEDDEPYDDLDDVEQILGISRWEFARVMPRLTLKHPIRRIVSRGQAGDLHKTITAIVGPGVRILEERQLAPPMEPEKEED